MNDAILMNGRNLTMTTEHLAAALAERVLGWGVAPDRFLLGGRRWLPRWRFQPADSLVDAFRALDAADPDEYSMSAVKGDIFCVRVRLHNRSGEARDHSKPRAITYALARALGLEVDQ
jgi:hypothetical protein